jgi:hypothetical protein
MDFQPLTVFGFLAAEQVLTEQVASHEPPRGRQAVEMT